MKNLNLTLTLLLSLLLSCVSCFAAPILTLDHPINLTYVLTNDVDGWADRDTGFFSIVIHSPDSGLVYGCHPEDCYLPQPNPVDLEYAPEPGTLVLVGLGLIWLCKRQRNTV